MVNLEELTKRYRMLEDKLDNFNLVQSTNEDMSIALVLEKESIYQARNKTVQEMYEVLEKKYSKTIRKQNELLDAKVRKAKYVGDAQAIESYQDERMKNSNLKAVHNALSIKIFETGDYLDSIEGHLRIASKLLKTGDDDLAFRELEVAKIIRKEIGDQDVDRILKSIDNLKNEYKRINEELEECSDQINEKE